ncbi:GDSL family lipase, partial [Streptomyces varsoviensis]
ERGGRTVSLGDLLGPEFAANPRELFGPDNYHPSAEGYATAAMAVLPTLCAALGLWPAEEEHPDEARREGILPVARAAA